MVYFLKITFVTLLSLAITYTTTRFITFDHEPEIRPAFRRLVMSIKGPFLGYDVERLDTNESSNLIPTDLTR